MVGTTLIATVVYMLLALMLCLLQPYTQINRLDGFTNAFVYVGEALHIGIEGSNWGVSLRKVYPFASPGAPP